MTDVPALIDPRMPCPRCGQPAMRIAGVEMVPLRTVGPVFDPSTDCLEARDGWVYVWRHDTRENENSPEQDR